MSESANVSQHSNFKSLGEGRSVDFVDRECNDGMDGVVSQKG